MTDWQPIRKAIGEPYRRTDTMVRMTRGSSSEQK